jgi:hypothetical protein
MSDARTPTSEGLRPMSEADRLTSDARVPASEALRPTNDDLVLARLRRFLLATSALLLAGTVVELLLVGHTEDFAQWIPFALCALGLAAVPVALWRPRRGALLALRAWALLSALGSLYGVYEHVAGNLALQREVNPTATGAEVLMGALDGGNPLLAPGVLTLAAALALAATYQHPAVRKIKN